jgi:two-component system, sensor histidine kinase
LKAAELANHEQRLLILAPTARDAVLAESVLRRAGIACTCFADLDQVCDALAEGAGAVLLPEETVALDRNKRLVDWLSQQPLWSDLPVLVLARAGADSAVVAQAMDQLGNVTVLERPIRVVALVSAVRTALRARQRQYEARSQLARIERSERDLREAHIRKDEFLAILAHELRNPLAPIRNSLHILRLTNHQHDPTVRRAGETMERQVDHLVRLVDDLLEVSRITRGKIELRMQTVDLASVLRSAAETSRPLIDEAGHQFSMEIPPESLALRADPVRLAQIFANLLNNAAKYTSRGGQIKLVVRRENGDVVISVRDTGIGIPGDMLPRVFELFTQVDRHVDRAQGGLGIGLTLVKRLVEMHNGKVEAHSEGPGRGSEFVVRLPLASVSDESDVLAVPREPVTLLASRRVLIVDDNRDSAESLGILLKLLGADVRVEYDGEAALRAVAAYRPAVVLLDIGMPGMDGHEVARQIRQQREFDDVTLIALTGWGQEEDRRDSRSAGFEYHLIKPADIGAIETLLSSIERRAH